jgi:hypothetical protein
MRQYFLDLNINLSSQKKPNCPRNYEINKKKTYVKGKKYRWMHCLFFLISRVKMLF